jgi:hypothetical protein
MASKHAAEALQTIRPLVLVQMEDRLGIGPRPQCVSAGLQRALKILKVVDLAVERDVQGPVLVGHRLMTARREIDHRETTVRQTDRSARPHAFVVWSAMPKRADHPGDDRLVRAPIVVERDEPCYAALA